MTRCVPARPSSAPGLARRRSLRRIGASLTALAVASVVATPTAAQERVQRPFPAQALRGSLQLTDPPEALLNGAAARLAPGARLRGTNNLLTLSAALVGQNLLVHYTRDFDGLIKDVWILRTDEATRFWPRSASEAATYTFDPAAQTWTR